MPLRVGRAETYQLPAGQGSQSYFRKCPRGTLATGSLHRGYSGVRGRGENVGKFFRDLLVAHVRGDGEDIGQLT